MNGLTIDGLDLGYIGIVRSGTGIYSDGTNNTMTIQNVVATNRATGFRLGDAGQDLKLTNNNLSYNNLALFLNAFSDGGDADTVMNRQTGVIYNPQTTAAGYLFALQDSNILNNDLGLSIVQYNAGGFVTNNRIEGNTTALAYATHGGPTPPSIMLNATGNYWGPGGGPGVGGNNNVSGTPIDTTGFLSSVPAVLYRDYGDDPIAFGFASRLIDFGARHIASGPILGTNRDSEADTIPITMSSTDDTTSTPDDEDAVFGVNAFDTVNGGIAASFASGLLIVNAGDMTNYSTETVVINKAGLIVKFQEGASTIGSLDDTVTDATLQLAGITLLAGQNNSSTQFDSPITATGGLTRTGTGTLTLTGANADTGPTTVVAGTLAGGGHRPRPRSQPVSPGQRQRRSDRFAYRRSAAGGHYGPHSGRHA